LRKCEQVPAMSRSKALCWSAATALMSADAAPACGTNGSAIRWPPIACGKAYFGFTDEELKWIDRWVRGHTVQRFGPVREVEKSLVLEVAFDSLHKSTRHKSGLAMRFPRISRIRTDKPAAEADRISGLQALVTWSGGKRR
jgi:hypothetical protein